MREGIQKSGLFLNVSFVHTLTESTRREYTTLLSVGQEGLDAIPATRDRERTSRPTLLTVDDKI